VDACLLANFEWPLMISKQLFALFECL